MVHRFLTFTAGLGSRGMILAAVFLFQALLVLSAHETGLEYPTEVVTRQVVAFLDSLTPEQETVAVLEFESNHRRDWHFAPRSRPGLRLDRLDQNQRDLAWSVMDEALSEVGYDKARSVILLEGILGEITGRPNYRDPENYAIVFFGDTRLPGAGKSWGWRFEGHHLSLSFTVASDHNIAFTPAFYGTNPAVVPAGHSRSGWRVLEEEHRLVFELLGLLSEDQRSEILIDDKTPGNIITGPGRERGLGEPEGLSLGEMTPAQRDKALRLIEVYVGNIGKEFARVRMEEIIGAGLKLIHFAWGGSLSPDKPHYYRFHGPTMIIEYDNTQGGGNHVHSVLHNPENLFGEDLLRRHREAHPH